MAGYLTLHAAEKGTGYILVKKAEEAAPDFAMLKAEAPAYQVYDLKQDQAQWTALVNLEKDTKYRIYVGVEYGTENHMGSISAKTLAAGTDDEWGILYNTTTRLARSIEVFEGQTILFPGIVNHSDKSVQWTLISPEIRPISTEYFLNTVQLAPNKPEGGEVLGESFSGSDNKLQYHLQFSGLTKPETTDSMVMEFAQPEFAVQALKFRINFQD